MSKWRHTKAGKEWAKHYHRQYVFSRVYNITIAMWDRLFEAQGRSCAVCKSVFPGRKNGHWSTDHDHKTGIVRGILCNGCNSALGHAKDDPQRPRALADYLERNG